MQDAHTWAESTGLEAHVIDLWFGHTKAASDKCYTAANETHYAKARSAGSKVSHFSDMVSHKVSQQAQESTSTQPQAYTSDTTENGTNEQESELLRNTKKDAVGDTGLCNSTKQAVVFHGADLGADLKTKKASKHPVFQDFIF